MEKPLYDHWCNDVTPLGTYKNEKYDIIYDLYWCKKHGPEARWGDFPTDCAHGVKFAQKNEALSEALIRFKAMGGHLTNEENRSHHTT